MEKEIERAFIDMDFWKEKLLASKDDTIGTRSFIKVQLKEIMQKLEKLYIIPEN